MFPDIGCSFQVKFSIPDTSEKYLRAILKLLFPDKTHLEKAVFTLFYSPQGISSENFI